MEQKKQIKISLKMVITLVSMILIIGIVLFSFKLLKIKNADTLTSKQNNFYLEKYNGTDYYIITDDYLGEHEIQYTNLYGYSDEEIETFEIKDVMTYDQYVDYCRKWDFEINYSNKNYDYLMFSYVTSYSPNIEARLAGVEYNKKTATLYLWHDESGVTADKASYVVIIPTTNNVNNIEIQNVYELEEYYNVIGKSPIENVNYTYEDNKILAQNAYIITDNSEINGIFNKMLDTIVQNHTIEISDSNGVLEKMDFISSASIWKHYSSTGYTAYGEDYSKRYTSMGNSYEFIYGTPRAGMLYDIALYYEWDVVLGLSNPSINPYYYETYPLVDVEGYTCLIEEDEENYILSFSFPNEGTETYYINKITYLLEKSEYNHDNRSKEYLYNYTDTVVTIPNKVFSNSHEELLWDKPIIYLYPEEETEVSVILENSEYITTSYPKYTDGWRVIAYNNGNLIDVETKKNLYALYYESKAVTKIEVEEDGFVVKGEDVATFLEEKLAILGLTERETEEFIIYWLPILQENKYNYIRFATMDEINENMPLKISPNPDTLIRVLMTYKGLESPIDVKEQELITPERTGFVAVEWGGTEIK